MDKRDIKKEPDETPLEGCFTDWRLVDDTRTSSLVDSDHSGRKKRYHIMHLTVDNLGMVDDNTVLQSLEETSTINERYPPSQHKSKPFHPKHVLVDCLHYKVLVPLPETSFTDIETKSFKNEPRSQERVNHTERQRVLAKTYLPSSSVNYSDKVPHHYKFTFSNLDTECGNSRLQSLEEIVHTEQITSKKIKPTHEATQMQDTFKCEDCTEILSSERNLEDHILIHKHDILEQKADLMHENIDLLADNEIIKEGYTKCKNDSSEGDVVEMQTHVVSMHAFKAEGDEPHADCRPIQTNEIAPSIETSLEMHVEDHMQMSAVQSEANDIHAPAVKSEPNALLQSMTTNFRDDSFDRSLIRPAGDTDPICNVTCNRNLDPHLQSNSYGIKEDPYLFCGQDDIVGTLSNSSPDRNLLIDIGSISTVFDKHTETSNCDYHTDWEMLDETEATLIIERLATKTDVQSRKDNICNTGCNKSGATEDNSPCERDLQGDNSKSANASSPIPALEDHGLPFQPVITLSRNDRESDEIRYCRLCDKIYLNEVGTKAHELSNAHVGRIARYRREAFYKKLRESETGVSEDKTLSSEKQVIQETGLGGESDKTSIQRIVTFIKGNKKSPKYHFYCSLCRKMISTKPGLKKHTQTWLHLNLLDSRLRDKEYPNKVGIKEHELSKRYFRQLARYRRKNLRDKETGVSEGQDKTLSSEKRVIERTGLVEDESLGSLKRVIEGAELVETGFSEGQDETLISEKRVIEETALVGEDGPLGSEKGVIEGTGLVGESEPLGSEKLEVEETKSNNGKSDKLRVQRIITFIRGNENSPKNHFYCRLCNKNISTKSGINRHVQTRMHLKRLFEVSKGGKATNGFIFILK